MVVRPGVGVALVIGLGASLGPGAAPAAAAARVLWPAVQDTVPPRRPVPQDTGRIERRPRRPAPGPGRAAEGDTLQAVRSDTLGADTAAVRFPEVDSLMRALIARPGFVPTEYRAESAVRFDAPRRAIELWGNAQIQRLGDRLEADSVVYVDTANLVRAFPPVTMTNADGQVVTADHMLLYHTATRRSTVLGARTTWGEWFVSGDATVEGRDTLWVRHGSFTSCDLEEPHYHFASDRMKLILGKIVVAWPVRLYFGDVPVFWFPFFAQDIRRGRHSGILPIRFGVNDIVRQSRGHRRSIENVGYYWAINDYLDAQVRLNWLSGIYTQVDGRLRYNWRSQFLSGNLGYSHTFRRPSGEVLSLNWSHAHKMSERSDLRASVVFTSQADFVRSTTRDPNEAIQDFRSDVSFNRRFDWGTLAIGGQRVQTTSGSRVTWNAPDISLTLAPVTLFRGLGPGLTWSGSGRFSQQVVTQDTLPDERTRTANTGSSLTLGGVSLSASTSYTEGTVEAPDLLVRRDTTVVDGDTVITFPDTTVLGPSQVEGRGNWSLSLGYRQRLIGSMTLTPALAVSGNYFRSRQTGLDFVSGPARISARASLSTDLYGFFPGVGPVRRIRHKVSPGLQWQYSPAVELSDELRSLRGFPAAEAREQHRITLNLSQTFEAKVLSKAPPDTAASDTAARDTATSDRARGRGPGEDRKLTLLSIQTGSLTYDFVRARETGQGLITDQLSNTLSSDLLRGLSVRMVHDLFEERADETRDFDPFLTSLNLSFSLGGGGAAPSPTGEASTGKGIIPGAGPDPLFGGGASSPPEEAAGATGRTGSGPWSVTLSYALLRTRPTAEGPSATDRQTLNVGLSFQPTPNWRANWSTIYDAEQERFLQHLISLQRDLHDWTAQFRFARTVTGNFSFDFTVSLKPAPDIKFDYRQQSLPAALRE